MAKPTPACNLMLKSGLCQIFKVDLQEGNLTLAVDLGVIRMAGNHQYMDLTVQQIVEERSLWGGIP